MEHNLENMKAEALENIKECLQDGYNGTYSELHNEVFNTDYYVIGTELARDILNEFDVFYAIGIVMEYEKEEFGEILTEMNDPEKLLNMLFYVIGDKVMLDIESISDHWDEKANDATNEIIIAEINTMLEKFN